MKYFIPSDFPKGVCIFGVNLFLSIIVNKTQQSGVRRDNQESMCVYYKRTFLFKEKFEGQVANGEGTRRSYPLCPSFANWGTTYKKTYLSLLVLIELFFFILWHCFQHGFM